MESVFVAFRCIMIVFVKARIGYTCTTVHNYNLFFFCSDTKTKNIIDLCTNARNLYFLCIDVVYIIMSYVLRIPLRHFQEIFQTLCFLPSA
jgi:uncharacterized membrane protein